LNTGPKFVHLFVAAIIFSNWSNSKSSLYINMDKYDEIGYLLIKIINYTYICIVETLLNNTQPPSPLGYAKITLLLFHINTLYSITLTTHALEVLSK
jgi:hypothetical protein